MSEENKKRLKKYQKLSDKKKLKECKYAVTN